jgi:hypothetical protein
MSAFAGDQLSGLAGEIRRLTESEQIDLAGYTEQRVRDTLTPALSAPLEGPKAMIRITFVVGGGKLVRSKYNDDLLKWVTTTMRDLGYEDDKSAAETFDSQGTFKYQHDTGANLKYVIVYPHVACSRQTTASGEGDASGPPSENTRSPEFLVTSASTSTLQEIVAAKAVSWKQKKGCLKVLQAGVEAFKAVESKLFSGQPLTDSEQFIYDNNSGCDEEKIAWLQSAVKAHVTDGRLTKREKQELLDGIVANLESEKDEKKLAALKTRKDNVEKASPITYALKYGSEVVKLRVRLMAMNTLELRGKTNSLTLADLKTLEEKDSVIEQISRYENASRCWFQDEEEFAEQCSALEREASAKYEKLTQGAAAKKPASKPKPTSSAGAWSTVSSQPKGKMSRAQAQQMHNKGSGFSAAFLNDDSD